MTLRTVDFLDEDILDANELASDGYSVYLTSTVVSTDASLKKIIIDLPFDGFGIIYGKDHPAQKNDKIHLSSTSGGIADGYYTIDEIIDDVTFTVLETIGTSIGGIIDFIYPSGASKIGFDPTGLSISATNVQEAISQLSTGINVSIDSVSQGSISAVNVITSAFLDAKVTSGVLTISGNNFILDVDGSITYIDDGDALKKALL